MPQEPPNPFDITKASLLTDDQISSFWVDLPGGGHREIGSPTSPTPMLIRGGKGSGKTHLMRYYSFALQKLRAGPNEIPRSIQQEGYVGVYFKCSGLNSGRFFHKGWGNEVWQGIFGYYCELWLAEHALAVFVELSKLQSLSSDVERLIVKEIIECFDQRIISAENFAQLTEAMRSERRQIDVAVNNAPITGKLDVTINATPGALVFGLPRSFRKYVSNAWSQTLVVYLIDEFENLSAEQQRYVNTLIRETEPLVTFKIGGRHYGFKTYKTFSDDEENKEGSEFVSLSLDGRLRAEKQEYRNFAVRLCIRRLAQNGYSVPPTNDERHALDYLRKSLPASSEGDKLEGELIPDTGELPHFKKLRKHLEDGIAADCAPEIKTQQEIEKVIKLLRVPGQPLLEKTNILTLYHHWSRNESLPKASESIHAECERYRAGAPTEEYAEH